MVVDAQRGARLVLVIAVVVAAAGLSAGAAWVLADPAAESDRTVTLQSESPQDPSVDSPPALSASNSELDAAYTQCSKDRGFDPGGVQVIVDSTGVPYWVKTGRDVAAPIHESCFAKIGGPTQRHSSHGNAP